MTTEQAKSLDTVDCLSKAGHELQKISGNHYWYLSPFCDERTPSFKVNHKVDRWFDFADGKGGNLVDLGTLLHGYRVSAFLQRINNDNLSIQKQAPTSLAKDNDHQINVLTTLSINTYPLVKYLRKEIADKYLSEVRYQMGVKTYYALGFKNDAGGYELRNQNFKGSSSPKGTTLIDNGEKEVAVLKAFLTSFPTAP